MTFGNTPRDSIWLAVILIMFIASSFGVVLFPSIYTAINFLVSIPILLVICLIDDRRNKKETTS